MLIHSNLQLCKWRVYTAGTMDEWQSSLRGEYRMSESLQDLPLLPQQYFQGACVYPCLPWSLKRHGELVLQSTVWDVIVHSSVWFRICSWVNSYFFVLLLFLVHPEQLPPRPWITLKERDQILPSGNTVFLFPVFKQWCAEELFFGFFFQSGLLTYMDQM